MPLGDRSLDRLRHDLFRAGQVTASHIWRSCRAAPQGTYAIDRRNQIVGITRQANCVQSDIHGRVRCGFVMRSSSPVIAPPLVFRLPRVYVAHHSCLQTVQKKCLGLWGSPWRAADAVPSDPIDTEDIEEAVGELRHAPK